MYQVTYQIPVENITYQCLIFHNFYYKNLHSNEIRNLFRIKSMIYSLKIRKCKAFRQLRKMLFTLSFAYQKLFKFLLNIYSKLTHIYLYIDQILLQINSSKYFFKKSIFIIYPYMIQYMRQCFYKISKFLNIF